MIAEETSAILLFQYVMQYGRCNRVFRNSQLGGDVAVIGDIERSIAEYAVKSPVLITGNEMAAERLKLEPEELQAAIATLCELGCARFSRLKVIEWGNSLMFHERELHPGVGTQSFEAEVLRVNMPRVTTEYQKDRIRHILRRNGGSQMIPVDDNPRAAFDKAFEIIDAETFVNELVAEGDVQVEKTQGARGKIYRTISLV